MLARSLLTLLLLGIIVTLSFDESVLSRFVPPSPLEYRTAPLSHGGVDFASCVLPELDPWDPENVRYINPNEDPLRNCKPTVEVITSVVDGALLVDRERIPKEEHEKAYTCVYRCLHPKGDRRIAFGEWTNVEDDSRPKCDVFEVNCGSDPKKWSYRYLHHQIYVQDFATEAPSTSTLASSESSSTPPTADEPEERSKREVPKSGGTENPDVLLMVIDSVSASSMTRALQSTMLLLREELDAVVFRHLNKVGMNSRPNGFAFLTGRQIYNIQKSPYSDAVAADLGHSEWCKTPLDNSSFVGFAFRDAGYRTLMAEDWASGVFNWPTCIGFRKKPVDHYMRPYQIRVGGHGWGKDYGMKEIVFHRSCREPHNAILDYLGQFVQAYKEEPKFGLVWMTDIAHDGINRLHHSDKHFYRFFYDNREKLRNAFVIVMGDHGLRFGKYRASKFGSAEDNNPALVVAVPERLRKGPLAQILRENAKQMITHYDLFATLSDIASVLPESRFSDFGPLDLGEKLGGVFHGSSLLRPLPKPRHCGNLRVPFEYCSCQVRYTRVDDESRLLEAAEAFIVEGINAEIGAANASEKCVPLELRTNSTVLERITPAEGLFRILVVAEPSAAKFSAIFSTKRLEDGSFAFERVSEEFSRLDSYSGQSECTSNARIRPLCYCRNVFQKRAKMPKKKRKG
ncbi:hypothetical protein QR680_005359 [Steinernema hermaphroditum]|uniref:Sulfatase N-terminal domain-containing protein n=1 Tax=Steinernema hermaphroditum TaxID=289476 RepID=A0AA39HTX1_9BILA|nr:hypothetical protein QR680_005359 [Steinernema hermaphroditum]